MRANRVCQQTSHEPQDKFLKNFFLKCALIELKLDVISEIHKLRLLFSKFGQNVYNFISQLKKILFKTLKAAMNALFFINSFKEIEKTAFTGFSNCFKISSRSFSAIFFFRIQTDISRNSK